MTQSELIDKLNDLMPEIISTRNPEAVMLKCARDNNFTPALLERLGQVFNTCKTLQGLQKSANRGDSFSLVDVPAMLSSYVTYSPDRELSRANEKAQVQAETIAKQAGEEVGRYSNFENWKENPNDTWVAGIKNGHSIEDLHRILTEEETFEYHDGDSEDSWCEIPLSKAAATQEKSEWQKQRELEQAYANVQSARNESADYLFKQAAEVRNMFLGKMEKWTEAKEDIVDAFGEIGAGVAETIETGFRNAGIVFDSPDLSKRACVRALVQDRHGILKIAGEMAGALQIYQEAESLLEKRADISLFKQTFGDKSVENLAPQIYNKLMIDRDKFDADGKLVYDFTVNDLSDRELASAAKWWANETKEPDPEVETWKKDPVTKGDDSAINVGDAIADSAKDLINTMRATHSIVPALMPTAKNMIGTYKDTVNEFRSRVDERAKAIDEAVSGATVNGTLQKLLLSDPILQEADPARVQTIFNTIAQISPSMAKSPEMMGPVLKEALQYNATPAHILKTIADFEKTMMEIAEKKEKLNQMQY